MHVHKHQIRYGKRRTKGYAYIIPHDALFDSIDAPDPEANDTLVILSHGESEMVLPGIRATYGYNGAGAAPHMERVGRHALD